MCVQLNRWVLTGDVSECKLSYTQKPKDGEALAVWTGVVSQKNKDGKEVVKIPVKIVGDKAKELENLKSGAFLRFLGSLVTDSYQKEGKTRYFTYLKAVKYYPAARGYYENEMLLSGRLSKDVTLWPAKEGSSAFCRSTIATKRAQDVSDFIDCVAFGKDAENISKYFKKGSSIFLEGSVNMSNYKGKNGEQRTNYELAVNRWQFADSKGGSGNAAAPTTASQPQQTTSTPDNGGFDALFNANMM